MCDKCWNTEKGIYHKISNKGATSYKAPSFDTKIFIL